MPAPNMTAAQDKMLASARADGSLTIRDLAAGNTFAALARAGLMTHDANGAAEPSFTAWVIGSVVYPVVVK